MQERLRQNTDRLRTGLPEAAWNAAKRLVMLENSPATRYRPKTRPEVPRKARETGHLFIRTLFSPGGPS